MVEADPASLVMSPARGPLRPKPTQHLSVGTPGTWTPRCLPGAQSLRRMREPAEEAEAEEPVLVPAHPQGAVCRPPPAGRAQGDPVLQTWGQRMPRTQYVIGPRLSFGKSTRDWPWSPPSQASPEVREAGGGWKMPSRSQGGRGGAERPLFQEFSTRRTGGNGTHLRWNRGEEVLGAHCSYGRNTRRSPGRGRGHRSNH